MKNVKNILTEIAASNFSVEDLQLINSFIVDQIKAQRAVQNNIAKISLSEGMTVKVNHPKLQGRQFILKEIKRSSS